MKDKWGNLQLEILCSINRLINGEYGLREDANARLLQRWSEKASPSER